LPSCPAAAAAVRFALVPRPTHWLVQLIRRRQPQSMHLRVPACATEQLTGCHPMLTRHQRHAYPRPVSLANQRGLPGKRPSPPALLAYRDHFYRLFVVGSNHIHSLNPMRKITHKPCPMIQGAISDSGLMYVTAGRSTKFSVGRASHRGGAA
jgi:hypothetical protein